MDFLNLSSIRDNIDLDLDMDIKELDSKDIAIIGISGQMSMADNVDAYWENILDKVECVREFPEDRKKDAERYLKFKGLAAEEIKFYNASFLERIDDFDPKTFHLTPKEAKLMDPNQRLFLKHTWNAIEDAGYNVNELKGQRIGVYSGISDFESETYFDILSNVDQSLIELGVSGNFKAIIPSRISYLFDFKGPSMVVDTACSSSLVAIHLACQALRNKDCDSAIVGSVRVHLFPLITGYRLGFESTDGRTKAFDDSATGTGVGEGAIAVMLKPLYKARADGDHIYAVIKGTAINQDGNSIGITAPNADAQADVIERAWKDAGVCAEDISYIETHGTGTKLGDPIEIDGINKAFSKYTSKKQFCAIGSVKSNVGHLYEVSGLASLIKCIFALNEKVIPPSINYTVPNRSIEFHNSPAYVNLKAREWKTGGAKRLCGISSFGLSGTNCHIIIEEPENNIEKDRIVHQDSSVLVLSGKTHEVLKNLVNQYLKEFHHIEKQNPKDVCYTAAVGRNHYKHRLAVVFSNYNELKAALLEAGEMTLEELKSSVNRNIYYGSIDGSNEKKWPGDYTDENGVPDLNGGNSENDLRRVAAAYTSYQNVSWSDLYGSAKRKRARLPSLVFEQERYWMDIPDVSRKMVVESRKAEAAEETEEILLIGRADGAYTESERKLGAIVKRLMEYNKIDIYENFYEIGGDSLLAMNMYAKINDSFKINLTVADILSNPTIELLAKFIDELSSKTEKKKITINEYGNSTGDFDGEIAIIGMAGRFPCADNVEKYWDNISSKADCIRDIPENRKLDLKNYLKQLGMDEKTVQFMKSGYLDEIDKFDYEYFGLSLKDATLMDPIQRGFLEVVYQTIESAGYGGSRLIGSNTGVFVGYTDDFLFSHRRFIYDSDPSLTQFMLGGNLNSNIPGRISYALDLRGPSIVIDTACSSSLVALNTAIKSMRSGECEAAIVGGAKIKLIPFYDKESLVGVESENNMIRAFDDDADGLVEGESICAVMLKPFKKAVADGDNIRAVIKGSAVNQDGTGMGIMAPRAETQTQVIIDAWKDAGVEPSTITYIETHGTGTKLGDLVEYEGMKKAFSMFTDEKQFCAIGSVKTNLGHLFQSAGLASLIKAVLSIENKKIAPSIHFDRPNRLIDFEESPFYYSNILRDWETEGEPRRCGVSCFGFSGTNSHVVLEEYKKDKQEVSKRRDCYIVTISAKSPEALQTLVSNYKLFFGRDRSIDLGQLSFTANIGRGHYNERIAIIARDQEDLKDKLTQLSSENWKEINIDNVFYGDISGKITIPNNAGQLHMKSTHDVINKIENLKRQEILDKAGLREICLLYVSGIDIPWDNFYEGNERNTVLLPTYPFLRKRCWFQPRPGKGDNTADNEVVNDYEILEMEESLRREEELANAPDTEQQGCDNDIEDIIIRAFKEVIGAKRVRPDDNFFELGGNSLKATKLASKIYQLLEILIPLSDILKFPTVRDFSRHISELRKENKMLEDIPVLPEQEFYDLSLKQDELWVSAQIYEDSSAMNITSTCMLHNFDIPLLNRAFEAVINRHPAMRTLVVVKGGVPKQTISTCEHTMKAYRYIDISRYENIDETIRQIINTEVSTPFNMEQEPLIRITLAKIDENRHLFVFVIHHIISDWYSVNTIMQDLMKYYEAFGSNSEPDLLPLPIRYTDFAQWHKDKIERNKGVLKKYWDDVLQGPLPILNIKTDFERPLIKGQSGKKFDAKFDSKVMGKLKSFADQNQGTMFMTILSGVYTLLYMYSGQNDIIVGTNTSGREHPHLQNQVGYYINVLPLRISIDAKDNYAQLYKKVQNIALEALEHQDYPFGLMLENEAVVRDTSRTPIFDVMVQLIIDPNNDEDMTANDARIVEIPSDSLESKYDMTFNFFERQNEIALELEYSDSLFKEETIDRMVKRLSVIFEEFSKSQKLSIDKIKTDNDSDKKFTLFRRNRR